MRILHTADWHLADRLGRIDRTDDLRKAVERIAGYCESRKVDVLLVAGDLFSELASPDALRDSIRHMRETFQPFLHGGGTILALTGNHDKENFCQTLRHAMSLAAPGFKQGALAAAGRVYLATIPTLLQLIDRESQQRVQFVLMPYPTPTRYLTGEESQRYQSLEEKNRHLMTAYTHQLNELQCHEGFDPQLQTVLAAHVHVRGAQVNTLFRITEQEDVVFSDADLPMGFAYIALGHIHRAQYLAGQKHVRYCGSIERLDLGEKDDSKGVVLFDIGPEGLRGEPEVLPLDPTPIYEIEIHSPQDEIPGLKERYPDAQNDLVRIICTYTAGVDNREEILRALNDIFPRWYDREILERNALDKVTLVGGLAGQPKSFEQIVREYLQQELTNHPEDYRAALLARAEELMKEVQA
ncbi:MAG TPA: exonuclease subunit SbcD [Gemmataceae bacterium]|jgi:exonuclease SbcD